LRLAKAGGLGRIEAGWQEAQTGVADNNLSH
jgi:hypothetical protein